MRPNQEAIAFAAEEDDPLRAEGHRPRRSVPTPVKVAVAVVLALVVGLVGRGLVSGGFSGGFLADLLPWLQGTPVTLYFADQDGTRLVPVSRTLSGEEDSPAGLMAAFLGGPQQNVGLLQLLPSSTTATAVSLAGTTLVVDLSADYATRQSLLADEALRQTMGSWPGVTEVRLTVEGAPLEVTPSTGHLLFFYDPSRDMLVAEPTAAISARDILAEYLVGPTDTHLIGLPGDVSVLDLHSAPGSGLLQLNMTYTASVRAMALDSGDSMRRVLEGLMATLTTGFSDTQFLYLDFEGRAQLGLGQCADLLRRVQPPPRILNDERLMEMRG